VHAVREFHFVRESLQLPAVWTVADDRQLRARVSPGEVAKGVIERLVAVATAA
jgi:hypothetical protein